MAVFAVTVFFWVFRPLLTGIEVSGIAPLAHLSDPVIAVAAAIALFILPIDSAKGVFVGEVRSADDAVKLEPAWCADADVRVHLEHPGFVGVRVLALESLDREICGGGLVKHVRLDRADDLVPFATEVDQTVTHFGFDGPALRALADVARLLAVLLAGGGPEKR